MFKISCENQIFLAHKLQWHCFLLALPEEKVFLGLNNFFFKTLLLAETQLSLSNA